MTGERTDRAEIRDLIEAWVVWRDSGDWQRFREVWHGDGRMMATWWQGPFEEFIQVSREGFDRGVRILHFLGGSVVDVVGPRAIAQTKMMISQRGIIESVACDVTCTGRFYDFFAKRQDRWGLVLRQPIYEQDRIAPVMMGEAPTLDQTLLASFPDGYRHLAYMQTRLGYEVKRDMPGLFGPELDRLLARGARWLAGGAEDPAG
jgi:SnoaL-like protein